MRIGWIGVAVWIWIIGAIAAAIIAGTNFGGTEQATLNGFTAFTEVKVSLDMPVKIAGLIPQFLGSLWTVITLNWTYLSGDYAWFRWIVLAPITVTIVYGIVITFFSLFQRSV